MNIVITGASRGIGKALAEKYATEGHNLLLCARNAVGLYKTLEGLQTGFPSITIKAKQADLSVKEEVIEVGEWVKQEAAKLPGGVADVLINNAGMYTPGQVHDEPDGMLEDMINLNLYSAYHLSRSIIPAMKEKGAGHIFNICSIAAIKAYANGGSYSISKFALLGFTKNLREEMKPFGIKVTAILPGAVYTDSWQDSGLKPERFIRAEDVADTIYLCSKLSPSATIEDIVIRPQEGDI